VEWTWITVLGNLFSAMQTAALIAAGCQMGYFWGSSAVLELGDGFINFENNHLLGSFPLSPNYPNDDRAVSTDSPTPLHLVVYQHHYFLPAIATNYELISNQTKLNQPRSDGTT
jgi:hypothetical protein